MDNLETHTMDLLDRAEMLVMYKHINVVNWTLFVDCVSAISHGTTFKWNYNELVASLVRSVTYVD